jgi:hypothetical protein
LGATGDSYSGAPSNFHQTITTRPAAEQPNSSSSDDLMFGERVALRRVLLRVHRGESELIPALHSYEAEMIDRGFRAVEASLKQMKQVHSQGRVAKVMRGFSLRTIDRFPVRFKRAIMQRQ